MYNKISNIISQYSSEFSKIIDTKYWIMLHNEAGIIIDCSSECEEITGYKPEFFVNNSNALAQIIHIDDYIKVKNHIINYKECDNRNQIFRIYDINKSLKWIELTCSKTYCSNNIIVGKRITYYDITNLHKIRLNI